MILFTNITTTFYLPQNTKKKKKIDVTIILFNSFLGILDFDSLSVESKVLEVEVIEIINRQN